MTFFASRVASTALGVAMVLAAAPIPATADVPSPLFALVDAAAQRLQTADPVAASKWTTGGPIEDHVREQQVIDAVTAQASQHGVDDGYVQRVFRDQISATVGVEYGRFSEWKLDPASAPTVAPNLSESRATIDGLNRTMVDEIAAQWVSLHSPSCVADLDAARSAVVSARGLDALYQRGLMFATGSYCR
jgi:chorismate mutase